jgi:hypothetical protein
MLSPADRVTDLRPFTLRGNDLALILIICTHLVPVLDRVLITMSPSRNGKPIQRALSSSSER